MLKSQSEFPSPMGIMSVSISVRPSVPPTTGAVSVPYGDHVCLNQSFLMYAADDSGVSVPYGDHVCLNTKERSHYVSGSCAVSVPYGDHVCLNDHFHRPCTHYGHRFRPLWGSCLSQYCLWKRPVLAGSRGDLRRKRRPASCCAFFYP